MEYTEYNVRNPSGVLVMSAWVRSRVQAENVAASLKATLENAGAINQDIVLVSRKVTVHHDEVVEDSVIKVNPR